jgi:hypothetical protein
VNPLLHKRMAAKQTVSVRSGLLEGAHAVASSYSTCQLPGTRPDCTQTGVTAAKACFSCLRVAIAHRRYICIDDKKGRFEIPSLGDFGDFIIQGREDPAGFLHRERFGQWNALQNVGVRTQERDTAASVEECG